MLSLKRRFELQLHGARSQKASVIDTAVKPFQRTVFSNHKYHPSLQGLSNSDSTATQPWNPITLRYHEDEDTFSETTVEYR
jgi:hypothetical protein